MCCLEHLCINGAAQLLARVPHCCCLLCKSGWASCRAGLAWGQDPLMLCPQCVCSCLSLMAGTGGFAHRQIPCCLWTLCFISHHSARDGTRQHLVYRMVPLGHKPSVWEEERRWVLKFDSCFEALLALDWLNTCRGGLAKKQGKVFCSVMGDKH